MNAASSAARLHLQTSRTRRTRHAWLQDTRRQAAAGAAAGLASWCRELLDFVAWQSRQQADGGACMLLLPPRLATPPTRRLGSKHQHLNKYTRMWQVAIFPLFFVARRRHGAAPRREQKQPWQNLTADVLANFPPLPCRTWGRRWCHTSRPSCRCGAGNQRRGTNLALVLCCC